MWARLAAKLFRKLVGDDKDGMRRRDRKGEMPSEQDVMREALAKAGLPAGKGSGNMEIEALEGLFEEMGAAFRGGRGSNARSGKGRHRGTRRSRRDAKGKNVSLTSEELRQEAGLVKAAQRYDDGDVFQAWSGNKDFWVRTGTEVFMGLDDAVTSITAGTIGTFEAAPNKEFEIQGLRIQHNGDGATAAATIAIHQTLLAHLAFSYINVGDDKMITGSNYVGADTLQDRETEGGDLAGFIVTPTQKLSCGVLNAAAYAAPVFITALGELVVLYGL